MLTIWNSFTGRMSFRGRKRAADAALREFPARRDPRRAAIDGAARAAPGLIVRTFPVAAVRIDERFCVARTRRSSDVGGSDVQSGRASGGAPISAAGVIRRRAAGMSAFRR